jgi:hypothetical protein
MAAAVPERPRNGRRRAALALAVVAVGCSATWAQVPPPGSLPVLAQAARTIGISRCLPAITAISRQTSQGATHEDVLLDWDHGQPDQAAFFSLTGLEFGTRSAAVSLTTVPEAQGGCSVLAERISAAPVACPVIAEQELKGFVGHPLLSSITVYTNPQTPRQTVTLVNSAPGCLIIRRQVEYGVPGAQ